MASVAKRPGDRKAPAASTDYLCYRRNRDGSLCTTTVSSPGKACRVHRGKHRALSVRNEMDMPMTMPDSVGMYFESPIYPHPELTPA
jgi:hypothetical protein